MTGYPSAGQTGSPGERNPLDQAADLLLYVPVGIAAAARDLLPSLAERGRTEVASQVSLARMVGQLVVRQGQDELGRAVGGARQHVGSLFEQVMRVFGGDDDESAAGSEAAVDKVPSATPATTATGTSAAAPAAATRPTGTSAGTSPAAAARPTPSPARPAPAAAGRSTFSSAGTSPARAAAGRAAPAPASSPVPAVESLAIPGYDSLAASQVVPRLAGLAPAELEAVRRYEAATRGRRTILGRVAQLQG